MRTEQHILAFRAAMLASLGLGIACGGESRAVEARKGGSGSGGVSGGAGGTGGRTGGTDGTTGGTGEASGGKTAGNGGSTGGTADVAGEAGESSGTGGATGGSGGAQGGAGGAAGNGQGGTVPQGGTSGAPQGGTSSEPLDCDASTPVLDPDGNETGFATCDNGVVHRVTPTTCRSLLPRDLPLGGTPVECSKDADCVAQAHGYCGGEPVLPPTGNLVCYYGCVEDADCDPGHVCQCGVEIGACIPAGCTTDAECGDGLCVRTDDPGMCSDGGDPIPHFACSTAADTCYVDADCATNRCGYQNGARACLEQRLCGIGRPFLVEGALRTATVEPRADFSAKLEPSLDLEQATRTALAEHWEKNALLEHASIASFARFSLELLALGAPAELVAAAAAAMSDETRHAELCFALAGAYGGRAVGPGPLSIKGVEPETDLARVVESVVVEGCIGETVAALEATVVAASAKDPVVRRVLEAIAEDERRHAELAFRFVRFVVARHPELARVAEETLALEERATAMRRRPEARVEDQAWLAHGVCPEALAHTLRSAALAEVVAPCLAGVIEIPGHATALAPRPARNARGRVLEAS